ncbi:MULTISPECIES: GNAT family N-acetyltransferase [unclassified Streptomyces]|uniref:GNAT family N-acetyltransferase n=1 Tax=unclassified Streptomyces TaxID=2593676 RepID=UPI0003803F2D|nr:MULTISPECIES: GNAT family N-acetyltransferase [unclassified Streptomyces]MYT33999.1 GNAT family N-acetyltransferase [Streptomyces sp. SID8354]
MRPTIRTAPAGELAVAAAPLDLWHEVVGWTADEGWNPGEGDITRFHPTDPGGFFLGRRGDRTVSSLSLVNYSDDYAFLGYYVVAPDLRGQGLGLATWRAALPYAGSRTIGLDGVPAQQATYRRAGFTPAHDTLRYTGHPAPGAALSPHTHPVTAAHLDAIAAYDRRCFPADRREFVTRWLTAPSHTARVHFRDGQVVGYGVLRPARSGHRIGPLFADTRETAEALFDALTAHLDPDDEVTLDIPEPNVPAHTLATTRGLTPRSHTVRMYTGPVPATDASHTFGVTSLELG